LEEQVKLWVMEILHFRDPHTMLENNPDATAAASAAQYRRTLGCSQSVARCRSSVRLSSV